MWDDNSYLDYIDEKNSYIENQAKGLSLITSFLGDGRNKLFDNDREVIRDLEYVINSTILGSGKKISLKMELDFYNTFEQLLYKIKHRKRLKFLHGKTIIGVGGQVNAGKSTFINSILNGNLLPEDQSECTAIPTYIIRGNERKSYAYTLDNREIGLDDEAVLALAHSFHKKYKIGFSHILTSLVVVTDLFNFDNVVILDTPGYNKDDSGTAENISDAQKAMEELKGVDYLIWIIDGEKGTINDSDLNFIREVGLDNPPLIVINKADIKPDYNKIVQNVSESLNRAGIEPIDIIAYSSRNKKEFSATVGLDKFLDTCNQKKVKIQNNIEKLIKDIIRDITKVKENNFKFKRNVGDLIYNSDDPTAIISLVYFFAEKSLEISHISHFLYRLEKQQSNISSLLSDLGLR
jgi:ribosome biogenesis GTPase A